MQRRYLTYAAAIASVLGLTYCSSGSVDRQPGVAVAVPGVSSAVTYSFDLGVVDPVTHKYYVTDRTNKAIDVFDPATGVVTQFKNSGYGGCNSGGTAGGSTNTPYVPMAGCVNITTTGIIFPNSAPGSSGIPVFATGTLVTNNDLDGPDGLDIVGSTLYVGDVNHLWVVNRTTGATVGSVAIPNTGLKQGFRSDEGCFDPVNHLYAIALTGDPNTPLYTILDTTAAETGAALPTILGFVLMNGPDNAPSGGLEACAFDSAGGFMYLNNDGSTANPNGEMDAIPIADLIAMRTTPLGGSKMVVFQGSAAGPFVQFNSAATAAGICALGSGGSCGTVAPKVFPLPALCDPTGLALGPGTDVGAMCRPGTLGHSLDFVILNRTTGATVQVVTGAGGGDQITYDATSNKWYLGDSRQTANSLSCGAGTAVTCPLTPQVVVVDGTSHAIVARIASGNNSHSIAVDGPRQTVYSPFTNSSASGGGAAFPNGGLNLFSTQ